MVGWKRLPVRPHDGVRSIPDGLPTGPMTRPDIIVLTNVRHDHTDTLGKTRTDLARSFARSVPAGTHVVSGEQHPVLHEYIRDETDRRGGTIEQVAIPDDHQGLIGAKTIHTVDAVLDAVDEPPLPADEIDAHLDAIQPTWTRLEDGHVFGAAEVNDMESTEMVRRTFAGDEYTTPFVNLRRDRRGRTASFARYIQLLFDRDLIEEAHVGGANTRVFAENTDVPTERHGPEADADTVLTELLAEGRPVVFMGNTVETFMREMQASIERRAKARRRTVSADEATGGSEATSAEVTRPADRK